MSESKRQTSSERASKWIGQLIPGATYDNLPQDWTIGIAGTLGLALQHTEGGMLVRSLHDLKLDRELGALQAAPLFTIELGDGDTRARITSEAGWQSSHVSVNWQRRGERTAHNHHDPAENNSISRGRGFVLEWSHPLDDDLGPLTVELHATLDARSSAIRWTLRVNNAGSRWSCRRVVFP